MKNYLIKIVCFWIKGAVKKKKTYLIKNERKMRMINLTHGKEEKYFIVGGAENKKIKDKKEFRVEKIEVKTNFFLNMTRFSFI